MTKSKLILLMLLTLTLGGCDIPSSAVTAGGQLFLDVVCKLGLFSQDTCLIGAGIYPPSDDMPSGDSDAAPFNIWVAEANSATAMSEIQLDPSVSTSPVIHGVGVFAGSHAGGITAWLDDPTRTQYGLYLWHDNTIEILSDAAAPVASMMTPVNGTIRDFTITADGLTGVATMLGDTHLYYFDLFHRRFLNSVAVGSGANPRASVSLIPSPGAPALTYATDAVNGAFYIVDQAGPITTLQLSTTPAELGKPVLSPDGTQVWVPDVTQNSIFIVNPVAKSFTSFTLPNLFDPREIVFDPTGTTAYILFSPPASFGPGSVASVKVDGKTLVTATRVGTSPSGLAQSPQGSYQFVANSGDGTVSSIDALGNVNTYKVGAQPVGIVAMH